jgi:hypothetical protein
VCVCRLTPAVQQDRGRVCASGRVPWHSVSPVATGCRHRPSRRLPWYVAMEWSLWGGAHPSPQTPEATPIHSTVCVVQGWGLIHPRRHHAPSTRMHATRTQPHPVPADEVQSLKVSELSPDARHAAGAGSSSGAGATAGAGVGVSGSQPGLALGAQSTPQKRVQGTPSLPSASPQVEMLR